MYSIWSSAFLDFQVSQYTCFVNEKEWIRLHDDFTTSKMFVKINNGSSYWICALDSPIANLRENAIYVPMWMLEQINASGMGDELHVEFMPMEAFDHSEQIVLECLSDDTFEGYDMEELLSNELTKLAILQKNTRITVDIEGLQMTYRVVSLAPASVVLCQGDDVYLEFKKRVPLPVRRDTPIPSPIDFLESESEDLEGETFVPIQTPEPVRFNPWRNKDFKPTIS